MNTLTEYLTDLERLAVFDGAIGTELNKYGESSEYKFMEMLNVEAPGVVKKMHLSYLNAGADILTTNTFSANSVRMSEGQDSGLLEDINRAGASIPAGLSESIDRDFLVAGSVGPTGESMVPTGSLYFENAYDAFRDQIEALKAGGVDLIVVETMESIREAKAACLAARDLGLPVIVSMTYTERGATNYGTPPGVAGVTFSSMGADVLGANCNSGPAPYRNHVERYKKYTDLPISIEPNAGQPEMKEGQVTYDMNASGFLEDIETALPEVAIAGSCCGSDPTFTEKLRSVAPNYSGGNSCCDHPEDVPQYVTSKRQVYAPQQDYYQLQISVGELTSLKDKLRESGRPLLRISDYDGDTRQVEESLARGLTRIASSSPIGFVVRDPDLLAACLQAYPGRPPIQLKGGGDERSEEICERYGAYRI